MEYYVYNCDFPTGNLIVFLILAAYKIILQVIALFIAFHTRRVKVKGLNETREIFTIIYINTVILTILITMQLTLQDFHDASAIVNGLTLFIEASLFLGLFFVPKVMLD